MSKCDRCAMMRNPPCHVCGAYEEGYEAGRAAERERVRPLVEHVAAGEIGVLSSCVRTRSHLRGTCLELWPEDEEMRCPACGCADALRTYLAAESEDPDHKPQGTEDPDG